MTSTDARWAQIKALFDAAVDRPPAEREALIAAAGLDAQAEAELRSLLAHHGDATGGFLAHDAAQALAEPTATTAPSAYSGQRLGDWEIVGALGTGGMGEVFEARRADGSYEGRAAIKLLKRGMDSAAVLQRFAQERQALARLNHPHIARLLDAGASAEGLPYFVMEYVAGQPLDAAAGTLTLEARLRLFLQLADAVAHAHRNLLVHRDLKPSNVLVDGDGQVKLLDFGIAKALDPLEGGGDSNATAGGDRPFTPNYASPEQVRGEPVSTATDIYSLGVLLYQMLTGTRPTGRSATTPAEAARSVLQDMPPKPSQALPQQSADPQWLATRKKLAGDLDNILLKALEKPVERRYTSVDALAADLRAHLAGRPVSARAPTWAYLGGRFVQRNAWAVGAAALAVAGLAVGLGAALVQADRATRAQHAADEQLANVKDLLRGLVLRYGYSVWLTPKGSPLMQGFVQDSLPRLERALTAAPDDLELKAIAADIYSRLGEMLQLRAALPGQAASGLPPTLTPEAATERANVLGEAALPARRGDGSFVARVAISRVTAARMAQQAGKPADGVTQLQAALAAVDTALALDKTPAGQAYLRGARGSIFMVWGQLFDHGGEAGLGGPAEAMQQFDRALAEFELFAADREGIAAINAASPEDDIDTEASVLQAVGTVRLSRAMVLMKQGESAPAQAEAEAGTAVYRRIVRDFRANVLFDDGLVSATNLLAYLALRNGQPDAALQAATTAWTVNNRLIASEGPQSKWVGMRPFVSIWYGAGLQIAGRNAEALPVLRESFGQWQAKAEADLKADPGFARGQRSAQRVAQAGLYLARAQAALGQRAEAAATLGQALQGMTAVAAAPKPLAETLVTRAELHRQRATLALPGAAADRAEVQALATQTLALPVLPADLRARATAWLAADAR